MWGWADDLLDLAKQRDPKGDSDWRVQMTRKWLQEYERPWPF
jgi:cyanate lyase